MLEYPEVDEYGRIMFERCLAYVNRDLYDYRGKQLDIQYETGITKNEINASADVIEKNKYLVTVEMPTINEILSLYEYLLQQPNFYMYVAGIFVNGRYDERLAFNISRYLSQITLNMIIFHELGHIFNGHVDYIKQNIRNDEGYSLRNQLKKARPFLEEKMWQALEWNADDFSATRIIGQILYKENLERNDFLVDYGHAFVLAEIATVGMFTLMGMSYECTDEEKRIFKEKEHLPLRFRMHQYIKDLYTAANAVGFKYNYDPLEITPILQDVEDFCVTYLYVVKEKKYEEWSIFSNMEELDDIHKKYYIDVSDFYRNNLNDILAEYAYFNVFKYLDI